MDLRYVEGDSRLHRMHPVVKGGALLLLVIASFIYGAVVNLALVLFLIIISVAAGIGSGRILSLLKPVPVFVIIIIAANILLVRNGQGYSSGMARGLVQGIRIMVLLLAAGLFWTVTDPARFSDSVVFLGAPLRLFGISREDLSLILMIIFSFIPHIREEVDRIRRARMVRCGHGGWLSLKKGGILPLVIPLISSVLRRGEEMEMALCARHYGAGRSGRGEKIPSSDILIGIIFFLAFLLGLYAKY
ncbi:MAG: energy-coupling factor transporter transmembrane component T [Candidatus Krumholzibacteriales bacterium]